MNIFSETIFFYLTAAVLDFLKKGVNSPDSMKLMMADDLGDKIPSNVTPWHADDKKHH